MFRLGLRLTIAGGKEALARLALIAVAVAIGALLLLATLASINALNTQNSRYAWLETAYTGSNAPSTVTPAEAKANVNPLWWKLGTDYFQGKQIARIDVAATGPNSPVPPGIDKLPGPGQFYASPALTSLLRGVPANQLANRFDGTQVGTIGNAALPAPNSLVVIVGQSVADLSRQVGAIQVIRIGTTPQTTCQNSCALGTGLSGNGMTLILSVVVVALLFPVLIFIGGATRLSAARREQRFAAMRLIGATPRQVSIVSTVESDVAAVAGVMLGFALFFLLRPGLAMVPFTGSPFFTSDLSLSLTDVLLVALGIPIGAGIAALLGMRRVNMSPLGVIRRTIRRSPRTWRLIPLIAGIAELVYVSYFAHIGTSGRQSTELALAYVPGMLMIIAGLAIAGPWLTMLGSRLMTRLAGRASTLIAGRRLADDPQKGFRAISGVVIALFIGTCVIAFISTVVAHNSGGAGNTAASSGTLVDQLSSQDTPGATTSVPGSVLARLGAIPGVTGVAVIHPDPTSKVVSSAQPPGLISCAQLAAVPALGRCPAGVPTAIITPTFGDGIVGTKSAMSATTWPATNVAAAELQRQPVDTVVVGTDGTTAAVERARSVLELAIPATSPPETLAEYNGNNSKTLNNYERLADVVMLASLAIAGCSLAVSTAGGLADRKRPFSLLRLTGAPLRVLQHVIMIESVVPLFLGSALAIGAGLLAASLLLHAQTGYALGAPGLTYFALIAVGLVAALAVIASTLPLLQRATGPEVARNE